MTTSLDHLLPAPEESLRCAEHARRIEVDPGGTAIRADRVVLVATPLPWPKPALDHPLLAPLVPVLAGGDVKTRILACLPDPTGLDLPGLDLPGLDLPGLDLTVYDRQGGSAVERRYHCPDTTLRLDLARAVAAGDLDAARPHLVAEYDPARPAVLVCTQGSHDVCCGSEGVRLAGELQAVIDATGPAAGGRHPFRVFRVSHTGGHRFAPTGMTLPDGRMWAGLNSASVEAVLTRNGDVSALALRCRGWWGATEGPAQVAERAVLADQGWSIDDADRVVTVEPVGEQFRCEVETATGTWEVMVAPGRAVPTIACRAPGGLPAKPGREFDVVSLSRIG